MLQSSPVSFVHFTTRAPLLKPKNVDDSLKDVDSDKVINNSPPSYLSYFKNEYIMMILTTVNTFLNLLILLMLFIIFTRN